mmetsp:Transcript_897/g.3547  ORF Transcript_897/g.3547 Transcript_897/m.3547 type:complete len:205 (+) Transcript_897:666-1280(+)
MTQAPDSTWPRHRFPVAAVAASGEARIASIVSRTSLDIASLTNTGCALTCRVTTARGAFRSFRSFCRSRAITMASANARSHTSSNPALSTTIPILSRPGSRIARAAAAESSQSKHSSPARSASSKACAARVEDAASPDAPLAVAPAAGQMLKSMRFPQSETRTNRRIVASAASSSPSPFANALSFGASAFVASAHAASPASLSL